SPATCTGQVCGLGTAAACPGGVKCASTSACLASCSIDNDCQSASDFCSGGSCVPKGAPGATCSATDQCTSGHCGTSGSGTHCCATTCPASVAACGATDCDAAGACV